MSERRGMEPRDIEMIEEKMTNIEWIMKMFMEYMKLERRLRR